MPPATGAYGDATVLVPTVIAAPGLVVVAEPSGTGRAAVARRVGGAFRGPVFAGGGSELQFSWLPKGSVGNPTDRT